MPIESPFLIPYNIKSPRKRAAIVKFQLGLLKKIHAKNLNQKVLAKETIILDEVKRREEIEAAADSNYGSFVNEMSRVEKVDKNIKPRLDSFTREYEVANVEKKESVDEEPFESVDRTFRPSEKTTFDGYEPWYLNPKKLGLDNLNEFERFNTLVEWSESGVLFQTVAQKNDLNTETEDAFEETAIIHQNVENKKVDDFNNNLIPEKDLTYVGSIDSWLEGNQTNSLWEIEPDLNEPDDETKVGEENFETEMIENNELLFRNYSLSPETPYTLMEELSTIVKDATTETKSESFTKNLQAMKNALGYKKPAGVDKLSPVLQKINNWKIEMNKTREDKLATIDEAKKRVYMNLRDPFSPQPSANSITPMSIQIRLDAYE